VEAYGQRHAMSIKGSDLESLLGSLAYYYSAKSYPICSGATR